MFLALKSLKSLEKMFPHTFSVLRFFKLNNFSSKTFSTETSQTTSKNFSSQVFSIEISKTVS